jgi:hypothetical protein
MCTGALLDCIEQRPGKALHIISVTVEGKSKALAIQHATY